MATADTEPVALFKYFVRERYSIHRKRVQGLPKPWTPDPILRAYRFCNVHRENDTVTKWIAANWRAPHAKDPDLWLHMALARLVNWPETLAEFDAIKWLAHKPWADWHPDLFVKVLEKRAELKQKVLSGAYIASTNGHAQPKAQYLAQHVLGPLWAARQAIRPTTGDTLASFHERLWGHNGMGSFMAAQVVADVKYVEPLAKAADWWTWAASGPGSRRGMNRVLGLPADTPQGRAGKWEENLRQLIEQCTYTLEIDGIPRLHAQDYQNCLCEYDKYVRTAKGEGTPRSKYSGRA